MIRVSSCCPLLQAIDIGEPVVVGHIVEHVARIHKMIKMSQL